MRTYNETSLLRNMSIVPIVVFISFSIIMISIIINYHKQQLNREAIHIKDDYINIHKNIIKQEVLKIHNIIKFEYNENRTVYKLPEEKIKHYILELIGSIEYDKNGYIFIVDYDGNFLINIKQSLLSENQINLKDKDGTPVTKKIITTAKKGEGYISYIGISGTHDLETQKISYIKSFPHWNWAIGYGFHPSDIQKSIDTKVDNLDKEQHVYLLEMIMITISITVILTIILMILSKNIENIFKNYKIKIKITEEKNKQKNEIIYHQSKMTVIGELLSLISHQWRQPLSQINSITLNMYLKQKNGSLNENNLKKDIISIENTTQYLSQTIDDFSNFFVPETEAKVFLVNDSIKHCINIINPSISHINLELIFNSTHYVNGYITLFQQIVLSLVSNSIDIFNKKNICNPHIIINTYDKDKFTFVEISDNGGGIAQGNLSKIFDLYFSTKTHKKGSGLGLYIVKKIITQHFHGDIFATNFQDGVKFTIRIKSNDTK